MLQVRAANRSDLPQLLDLYQHLSAGDARPTLAEAEKVFEHFNAYSGSVIFIGEVDGLVVVSCSLIVVPNLTRGGTPYGLIENVVTHSEFRKRGFGKRVLQSATDAAWDAGCYKVMLMTGSRNPETLNFYMGAGFEQSKTGFQKRRVEARAEFSH
ncbi:GNAT family N-acetyltransferase [Agrobacterium sp. rho-13.3]|jgi:GNAT superfamily N-acetyltransferase|uniref:GNAT family N-acetyltransferase n=1 Tax=Agrobacterium sp. rho-13.3 TaxID=3072980 RepID=UPI002A16246C|nr:GNAT family N-acetyltransferase [Agrobacterium sp. rho-13.3]MDX8310810.1 GNAT family N-acetyltransferase [Agrobacterium sp. rho-13.3]